MRSKTVFGNNCQLVFARQRMMIFTLFCIYFLLPSAKVTPLNVLLLQLLILTQSRRPTLLPLFIFYVYTSDFIRELIFPKKFFDVLTCYVTKFLNSAMPFYSRDQTREDEMTIPRLMSLHLVFSL